MAGGMIEGTLGLSYAKTMIDLEQVDAFYHFSQGCRFDDIEEIFEAVKEVGPGGHFLGTAHTRKSNLFIFPSQNNVTFEQWEEEGRMDAAAVGLKNPGMAKSFWERPALGVGQSRARRCRAIECAGRLAGKVDHALVHRCLAQVQLD